MQGECLSAINNMKLSLSRVTAAIHHGGLAGHCAHLIHFRLDDSAQPERCYRFGTHLCGRLRLVLMEGLSWPPGVYSAMTKIWLTIGLASSTPAQ